MDSKLLLDFIALHETGGFAKASRRRYVSQPTFSKRIRSLEEWIDTPLVDRHSHPVALTPAGERFVHHARSITTALDEARREIQQLAGTEPERVAFAAATTLLQTFFPKWITPLREQLPELRARVQQFTYFVEHIEALHNRDVDYFLSYASDAHSGLLDATGLVWKTVGVSALFPVCATNPDGAARHFFTQNQTASVPHIARYEGSFLGEILNQALADWQIELDEVFMVGSTINMRALVREGHGVGWLTQESIARELEAGELVRAADGLEIPLEIRLYRLDSRLNPMAEKLWDFIC